MTKPLAQFESMSDDALFDALRPNLSVDELSRLHQLNAEAKARELTAVEQVEQDRLLELYQQAVLRRAQVMAILHQRGHELSREVLEETMPKTA